MLTFFSDLLFDITGLLPTSSFDAYTFLYGLLGFGLFCIILDFICNLIGSLINLGKGAFR